MERPSTRRGNSQAGYWESNQDMSNDPGTSNNTDPIPGSSNTNSRPITRMAGEYGVAQKPIPLSRMMSSGGMRPTTSSGFSNDSMPPQTAVTQRIVANRPGSRTGMPMTGSTNIRLNAAAERPTTQQGLGGLKTASRGLPQRQIQDKSYYLGLLRAKMTELNSEMAKLNKGIEKNNKEQQSLPSLEKKVKEMALEITELQGQAADLNLLQEKIATSSDPSQMESELQSLLVQNERESHEVEQVFDDIKTVKEKLGVLERDIQRENEVAERFITTLPVEEQAKYSTLKNEQDRLAKEAENRSVQVGEMESRARKLEAELRSTPAKEEMFHLRQSLAELEAKQELMAEQDSKRLEPEEEKAQLLGRVKSDNAEIAVMEQQIKDVGAQLERVQNEQKEVDNSFEESQSERGQKYRDLRKREQVMDEFLNNWEDNCTTEKERLTQLESQIVLVLNKLGKQQSLMQLVPSISDYTNAKEDLQIKEGELEKSRATLEGIALEYQKLQNDLYKIEDLETRIREELATLKEKVETIQNNAVKFSNVEELRQETQEKRNRLILEQEDLADRKKEIQGQVANLQSEFDQLQSELDKNETHVALHVLDEKLRLIDEENKTMKSYVTENQNSHNVPQRRENTMKIVQSYLKNLQMTTNL